MNTEKLEVINFEKNLTNENDITIYARSAGNESAEVEVYEKDSEKSRAGIDEELEEESVEIDAAETIEHMIDEAEFKKENEEN